MITIDIQSSIKISAFADLFDGLEDWIRIGQIDSANYGDGYDFEFQNKVPVRFYHEIPEEPILSVEFDRFDSSSLDIQFMALDSLKSILNKEKINIIKEWSNK